MMLLTKKMRARLEAAGRARKAAAARGRDPGDAAVLLKVFTPDGGATWLLAEIDPDDPDLAFGLCDLGLGCPELGHISLIELGGVRGRFGLPVEIDRHFRPDRTLLTYAREAAAAGRILA